MCARVQICAGVTVGTAFGDGRGVTEVGGECDVGGDDAAGAVGLGSDELHALPITVISASVAVRIDGGVIDRLPRSPPGADA
jgi:hypothetical protein